MLAAASVPCAIRTPLPPWPAGRRIGCAARPDNVLVGSPSIIYINEVSWAAAAAAAPQAPRAGERLFVQSARAGRRRAGMVAVMELVNAVLL